MSNPSVSIVIPCYNGAKYLCETLGSAAQQSYAPIEIIVIDDGSTDQSAILADAFGPPVRVIRQPNQGESVARNVGIAAAKGDLIQFLDADDLLAPEAIFRKVEALKKVPGGVAIGGCAWFEKTGSPPTRILKPDFSGFFPTIIVTNFGPPHCWLTPKSYLQQVGGFCETMRWFEDWDLWARIAMLNPPLVMVPHIGAFYRQHSQSQLATTKDVDRARGHVAIMERLCTAICERDELLQAHGETLFWSVWTAWRRASEKGVPSRELEGLTRGLKWIARKGPASVRKTRSARMFRWLGLRGAERVLRWFGRPSTWAAEAN